jgi:hypothetical protein
MGDNLLFLAEHTHYFRFCTAEAKQLKQQIQDWYTSEERDAQAASDLMEHFRTLYTDPVALGCGWYEDDPSHQGRKMRWMQKKFSDSKRFDLHQRQITVRSSKGCYLPIRRCFLGMLPQEIQPRALQDYLQASSQKVQKNINSAGDVLRERMTGMEVWEYHSILTKGDNFTWYRGLVHGLSLIFALCLAPQCVQVLWTFFYTMIKGSAGVAGAYRAVLALPVANCFPLIVLLTMLALVIAVLICFRRSVWESYFGLYRTWFRILYRRRTRRAKRNLRRLQKSPQKTVRRLLNSSGAWRKEPRQRYTSLALCIPQWIRVDINPRFNRHRGWKTIPLTLCTYPIQGKKGSRSRSRGATVWRTVICLTLFWILMQVRG